jgi:hypothetical protein
MGVEFRDICATAAAEQPDLATDLGFMFYRRKAAVSILHIMIGHHNITCDLNEIFYIAAAGTGYPSRRVSGWNLYFAHIDNLSLSAKKILLPAESWW